MNKVQLFLKSLTLQQLRDFEVICSGGELPVPGHYDFFVAVVTEKNNRNNTMPAVYVTVWDDVGEVRTKCEFNDAKMTVKNIEQVDMELNGVCEREFIDLPDGRTFDTFFNEDSGLRHEPDNADADEFVNHRLKPNGETM